LKGDCGRKNNKQGGEGFHMTSPSVLRKFRRRFFVRLLSC
jgi:hypothetical protein